MKNLITKNLLKMAVVGMNIIMLTACNGIFDDIYDQPKEIVPAKGQMVINATSWTDWYYVDLNELHQLTINGDEEALLKAQKQTAMAKAAGEEKLAELKKGEKDAT